MKTIQIASTITAEVGHLPAQVKKEEFNFGRSRCHPASTTEMATVTVQSGRPNLHLRLHLGLRQWMASIRWLFSENGNDAEMGTIVGVVICLADLFVYLPYSAFPLMQINWPNFSFVRYCESHVCFGSLHDLHRYLQCSYLEGGQQRNH